MAEQEKKALFYGDKLPDAVLPDKEWKKLYEEVNSIDDPKDPYFRKYIYHKLEQYAEKYCVGENEHRCLFCGAEQNKSIGLCYTCFNSFRTRGVIRTCGRTRIVKNSALLCSVCKNSPGRSMGMCYNCYRRMRHLGLHSAQELLEYETTMAIKNEEEFQKAHPNMVLKKVNR